MKSSERNTFAAVAVPADHRELMLLAAADLESWMKPYGRDGATEGTVKRLRDAALATSAPPASSAMGGDRWRPMATAPKDGTIVRLLVDYSGPDACHPLEDALVTHTIGGNTDGHTGLNEGWKFAGWSWEQDCFCEGRGRPLGWLPFAEIDGVESEGV